MFFNLENMNYYININSTMKTKKIIPAIETYSNARSLEKRTETEKNNSLDCDKS